VLNDLESGVSLSTNYGIEFMSAYENGNIFATQFHPEKSQSNGLQVLKNFLVAG
jgi:imidazoleglycerol phosphate synthase glutamine amidotransferase subunit HisH